MWTENAIIKGAVIFSRINISSAGRKTLREDNSTRITVFRWVDEEKSENVRIRIVYVATAATPTRVDSLT